MIAVECCTGGYPPKCSNLAREINAEQMVYEIFNLKIYNEIYVGRR